ncbi:ATP-dependent helicase Lhr and Lhr-like helicase [Halopelagius inordinatus]|uniref:ATP-dependent helicase Lhr and Lhr-like helicase n=1 Tax=Halopelagius inordinatus TaxID=553467 RepID=A0A1I2P6Q5_9EURY|nr:DEAD/DEAH box helicase [Halopelagius inordinatus]SFG11798.1 ATP-dependent helicase Lhr and Lhr-like helicase [Halopelagius inordinatus]
MQNGSSAQGMDAFTLLGETVRDALSKRGFTTPTEPQRRAIPPLAEGRNALVIAPTGTGKTETAMLPVLNSIVESPPEDREGLSALYITPLRALNRDMRERLDWWGEELDVEIDVRHGDTTQYQRQKQANDPPDVLVTTPETLQAMLTGKKLRTALSDVRHVVVDEVHELASAKRGAQLTIGLERLRELSGPFQRIGLSATVGSPEEVGKFLTGDREFEIVEVDVTSKVDFTVVHPEVTAEDETLSGELATDAEIASHVRVVRDVVREHESTLVFVNTRQTAEALGSRVKKLGAPIEVHHGSLSKDVRIDVEDRFKAGELDALVCTSSMELGIDVGRVDHVVQYGSPREVSRLLQRVGRAGHRRDQTSRGTVVTSDPDDTLEALAIARRAEAGDVEPAHIHHGSLDTVANQIVGVVMDTGEASARKAYELVTAAYPFRDLSESQFRQVVRQLHSNRLLWLDEEKDLLEKSGGTWQYFYANLSMIPDEETYDVHDMSSRRQIGTLDERFVVNFAEPGASFVQRGEMWRINDIDDEEARVNVAPIEDPTGEVPSWTGSEIPVPEPVAGEVGEIREIAARQFEAGADRSAVARDVLTRYPTDEHTVSEALKPVERQVEAGHPIPTADRLVLEGQARRVVLNSCHGHRVNETLGRLLAALVGQRTGSSVGIEVDPYRVSFEVPPKVSVHEFVEVLEATDPDHVEGLLELALKHSDSLKFTLAQVAAKFGALKRYRGNKRFGADRLVAALEDTPVYDEAVREVFHVDLAVPETTALLRRTHGGDVELTTARERTPIGVSGSSSGRDFLVPENADASVIDAIRDRIRNDRVILMCLHCTEWTRKTKVRRVPDEPECPDCGATRIACLNPWDEETVKAVRATEKDDEQERLTRRAYRSASLVQSHGKQAVIALAARGVGPQNAARIIAKLREDEADFYRDILAQERQYARTQSFWD